MNIHERREKVAQMSKSIFQYCLSRTSSWQESEDLSQEIMLTLCRSIENLRDEKAFYAFVWRTADNILKGWYRDKDKRIAVGLDDTVSDGSWEALEEQAEESEQLQLMTRELSLLSSGYRRVMVAYYIDGLSVKDIAARFSLTQSMVKYLLFQSRKRVKEGITMERTFGEYSYNPVKLDLRWLTAPVRDYTGLHFSNIQQNILMACYYDKQNEEQLSLQLGMPTAYLEDELKNLLEYELLTEKNGFYLTNVMINTKRAMTERFQAKADLLKEAAGKIRAFFEENEERIRSAGFYGSDMSVNSLRWLVLSRTMRMFYEKLDGELYKDFPDPETCPCARLFLIEQEEAPVGDNYDPLMMFQATDHGQIMYYWIRFNSPRFCRLSDVQANVLTMLPSAQPETENDKMTCTELIDMGCAVRTADGIKPNYPHFTSDSFRQLCGMLEPLAQELFLGALDRADLTKKITSEHTPERFQPYLEKTGTQMGEEMSDITRLLVEDSWLVPWTGMNPTNIIITK
ncbi:MAG: sigma-70 family RNA polymerase sigma factor [Oscillospiraceae bacterium]|nr:sigma-70 family RNA polymerase sigma factor [Oscillospiraceae bacterium]